MGEPPNHTETHVTLAATTRKGNRWVQVPRRSMEMMALLLSESPSAAALIMRMSANMGANNALVASNAVLGELSGLSLSSVKRALKLLHERNWITLIKLGPTKSVRAIVINDQVAWDGPLEGKRRSWFSATVLVSSDEQDDASVLDAKRKLAEVPAIYRGEQQLPIGPGVEPPHQPQLGGMEVDLPTRDVDQYDIEDAIKGS
jgi:hypothetical protein